MPKAGRLGTARRWQVVHGRPVSPDADAVDTLQLRLVAKSRPTYLTGVLRLLKPDDVFGRMCGEFLSCARYGERMNPPLSWHPVQPIPSVVAGLSQPSLGVDDGQAPSPAI